MRAASGNTTPPQGHTVRHKNRFTGSAWARAYFSPRPVLRNGLTLLAAALAVFVTLLGVNTSISIIELDVGGVDNALVATALFLVFSVFAAAFFEVLSVKRLDILLMGALAAYVPVISFTGGVDLFAEILPLGTDDVRLATFIRIVKNLPALLSGVMVFWAAQWLLGTGYRVQDDDDPIAALVPQSLEAVVRAEALNAYWVLIIAAVNVSIALALILMAAGFDPSKALRFCSIVSLACGLALLVRSFLQMRKDDANVIDTGLRACDIIITAAWGSLSWFARDSQDTASLALILVGLLVGGVTIGFLSARRPYPAYISLICLFFPLWLNLVLAQPPEWFFFLVASIIAGIFCFILAEGLRRQYLQNVATRVALQEANMELAQMMVKARAEYDERERLLQRVGHDLRQPILALGFFIGRLDGGTDGNALDRAKKCLKAANTVMDNLTQLRSSGEAMPTSTLTLRPVKLDTLFAQMESEFGWLAAQKRLKFSVRTTRLAVHGNHGALERVVRNLLSNAVRVTAHGGVLLAARKRGSSVEIVVADTGPGMDAASPPSTPRPPQTNHHRGESGLGLSIVRELTAEMSGRVTIRSAANRGTVITITLPSAPSIKSDALTPDPAGQLNAV